MSLNKDFFKAFLSNRKSVGSVVPSSRFLTRKILDHIDFGTPQVIVELGPGTGVFTKEIITRMHAESKLLVIELNEDFANHLKSRFIDSRVEIIQASATELPTLLHERHIQQVNYIVSSLPLTSIPAEITREILETCERTLAPGGKFIQFQYSLQQRKKLEKLYTNVNIQFTPLNFPPAFVYCCQK
jgi:phosphatidylethanolamine/phosphatidyl-N-methylethanolamine N-methyltransferase